MQPDDDGDDCFVHVNENPKLRGVVQVGVAVTFQRHRNVGKGEGKYKGTNCTVTGGGGGGGEGKSMGDRDGLSNGCQVAVEEEFEAEDNGLRPTDAYELTARQYGSEVKLFRAQRRRELAALRLARK